MHRLVAGRMLSMNGRDTQLQLVPVHNVSDSRDIVQKISIFLEDLPSPRAGQKTQHAELMLQETGHATAPGGR
jgi:hypothetical protein